MKEEKRQAKNYFLDGLNEWNERRNRTNERGLQRKRERESEREGERERAKLETEDDGQI